MLQDGAELTLSNSDPRLHRLQFVLRAAGLGEGRVLSLVRAYGSIAGEASIGSGATQVVIGPFGLGPGTTRLTILVEPAGPVELAPPLVQSVADFSVSVRADAG